MDAVLKLVVHIVTILAWGIGIALSVTAVAKGRKMREKMGVSLTRYLMIVAVTEVLYTIGALMILAAMGVHIWQYLIELNFLGLYEIITQFDIATVEIVGIVGWVGFVLNRSVSYLSPLYLLIAGGMKLHPYFRVSAWVEISLETVLTALLFVTLRFW